MEISYEEGKKNAWKGFWLLLIITVSEVAFALFANGHIGGVHLPKMLVATVMVLASAYKAKFIIFEFMHMGHEVKGLAMTVLLPFGLLIWAIIAFLWEGSSWKHNREFIKEERKAVSFIPPVEPKKEAAVPAKMDTLAPAPATDTLKIMETTPVAPKSETAPH
jgi:heme/copper-type cytochrome/quinol oxidase subunit 4